MKLSEAIDQVVEIAVGETYEVGDMPEHELSEVCNDLYNRIEGHVFAWQEEQED